MVSKEIAIQCSLLPAPPLCFGVSPDLEFEQDMCNDQLDADEDTTDLDDSDADYMTETSVEK